VRRPLNWTLGILALLTVVLLLAGAGSIAYFLTYGNAATWQNGCYGNPPGLIPVDRDTHWEWWWPPRWYCRYKRPDGRLVALSY
jgi:hypothetical protein